MACKLHRAKPSESKTVAAAVVVAAVVVAVRHPVSCGLAHPALGKHLDKQKRQQYIDEQHQQHELLAHKPILQRNQSGISLGHVFSQTHKCELTLTCGLTKYSKGFALRRSLTSICRRTASRRAEPRAETSSRLIASVARGSSWKSGMDFLRCNVTLMGTVWKEWELRACLD